MIGKEASAATDHRGLSIAAPRSDVVGTWNGSPRKIVAIVCVRPCTILSRKRNATNVAAPPKIPGKLASGKRTPRGREIAVPSVMKTMNDVVASLAGREPRTSENSAVSSRVRRRNNAL
jgi:hypothetical protein